MSGTGVEAYTFDKDVVEKAYAGWAPIYDMVFGAIFAPGRAAAIRAAERIGGRVLDGGVGTGLSLDQYSPRNRIVGIDLSEPMLRRAIARMQRRPLPHVEMLAVMNAERLAFADDTIGLEAPSAPDRSAQGCLWVTPRSQTKKSSHGCAPGPVAPAATGGLPCYSAFPPGKSIAAKLYR